MAGASGNEANGGLFLAVLEAAADGHRDFFRARLDTMIDMRHPLAVLATRMPWAQIEASLAPALGVWAFAHRDRKGRLVEGADLFGPSLSVAGAGISYAGRPRLPIRLMVALLCLKHAFNESDESLVERWSENVVWQFFRAPGRCPLWSLTARLANGCSGSLWIALHRAESLLPGGRGAQVWAIGAASPASGRQKIPLD